MATMTLELTEADIARRAYEIFESEECGTEEENWLRAEQELLATAGEAAPKRRRLTAVKTGGEKTTRARKAKPSG
jgi:Protein of unknown function (DUF2934)